MSLINRTNSEIKSSITVPMKTHSSPSFSREATVSTRCEGGLIGKIKHLFTKKSSEVKLESTSVHVIRPEIPPLNLNWYLRECQQKFDALSAEIKGLKDELHPSLYASEKEEISSSIREREHLQSLLLTPENSAKNPHLAEEIAINLQAEVKRELTSIQNDIMALQETPRHELQLRNSIESEIMRKNCYIDLLEVKISLLNDIINK